MGVQSPSTLATHVHCKIDYQACIESLLSMNHFNSERDSYRLYFVVQQRLFEWILGYCATVFTHRKFLQLCKTQLLERQFTQCV
jgi:hypothetical protein